MPAIGLGTFMLQPPQAEEAVCTALQLGYRLVDTANGYMNERAVGRGISNFEGERLANLLANAEIMPHVIQLEAHPYYIDSATMDTLAPHGTKLMAWYPLGHGDKGLLEEPLFVELGAKYGKTMAQIILRWHIQMGICPIPGSKSPEHIKENGDIFDFELTDDEMAEIAKLNKNVRYYNPDPERIDGFAKMAIPLDMQP